MPKLNTARLGLSYQQAGNGPDLVMIHGLAANQVFWYTKIFPAFTPDFRVTLYDLRGHGLSDMPTDGYTTADHAQDLKSLLDNLGIEKPHLVGHSLGAAIALHFATLYPERVASVSLIDCRLHALQPMASRDDEAHWKKRREEIEAKGIHLPEDIPRAVYTMVEELADLAQTGQVNPNSVPGLVLQDGGWNPNSRSSKRWTKLVTTTTIARDLQSVAGLTREKIASISTPIQMVYGENSNCLPSGRLLHEIFPEAPFELVAGLGHFFPVVKPEAVISPVLGFLKKQKPSHPQVLCAEATTG
jgi:pimeloyl-ACP methyl ester carboxylesterase